MASTCPRTKIRDRSRNSIAAGSIPTDRSVEDPAVPIETETAVVLELHEVLFCQPEQTRYVFLSFARPLFIEKLYSCPTS